MSAAQTLAGWIMRGATACTPADRAEWSAAMQAEFSTLAHGATALSWALGCLANALAWRMRTDGLFVALLIATPPLQFWLTSNLFFFLAARLPPGAWMEPYLAFEAGSLFVPCMFLAILRPKLAWIGVLVAAFIGPGGLISWSHPARSSNPFSHFEGWLVTWARLNMTRPDNPALNHPHLHNWQLAALVVWERLGPCVYGAVVGLGLAWLIRHMRRRIAARPQH